jgi:hypothetical protein
MSVIKTHAIRALRNHITCRVPELVGKVCAGPAESPKLRTFPHLSITPVRFSYWPNQMEVHKHLGAAAALMDVGRFEGLIQLRLGAQTTDRRAYLAEKITNLFLETEGRPGILLTTIEDCHDMTVAWELGDDEWQDEQAFAKKWFSILTVTAQIPALVKKDGVFTIEDLRLSLTEDLTEDFDEIPASEIETVTIDEDGTLTQA